MAGIRCKENLAAGTFSPSYLTCSLNDSFENLGHQNSLQEDRAAQIIKL